MRYVALRMRHHPYVVTFGHVVPNAAICIHRQLALVDPLLLLVAAWVLKALRACSAEQCSWRYCFRSWPFLVICDNMRPYVLICGHLRTCGPIWTHEQDMRYAALRERRHPYAVTFGHMWRYAAACMISGAPCGYMWIMQPCNICFHISL